MEIKKSSNANNENLRFPIALMAFLFVGGLLLASFTYETMLENDLKAVSAQNVSNVVYQLEEDVPEPPKTVVEPEAVKTPQPEIKIIPPKPDPPKGGIILPPPKGPQGPPPPPPPPPAEVIKFPDVEAKFPGGSAELQKWIFQNVEYPEISIEMEDQGKVYLSFTVEVDGSITDVRVTKKVTRELDREAARVTRNMPRWVPGEVAGKRVRTQCTLPIVFTLED